MHTSNIVSFSFSTSLKTINCRFSHFPCMFSSLSLKKVLRKIILRKTFLHTEKLCFFCACVMCVTVDCEITSQEKNVRNEEGGGIQYTKSIIQSNSKVNMTASISYANVQCRKRNCNYFFADLRFPT